MVLAEQKGPESATDTKDIWTPRCQRVCCAVTPVHAYLPTTVSRHPSQQPPRQPLPRLPATLSLPVLSFLLVSAAPGGFLPGSAMHSQLRLVAALFLVNGMKEGKERKGDLAEISHSLFCWKAPQTFSVHTEQRKVGSCQAPPPVTHLCFDDSLQSQSSASSQPSSSPAANDLRNHQLPPSPSAPLLPGLAREGPVQPLPQSVSQVAQSKLQIPHPK